MSSIGPIYSLKGKRVWVAGHRGMVGSALLRRLAQEDCTVLTVGRQDLDLRRQAEVEAWMKATEPQAVFLAAAKVGGIVANDRWPAQFLYDNLAIA
ncbi:MAG: NAD-dependent epimerase/dehydratase family protein, partial [Methyloceanibacter sp.]